MSSTACYFDQGAQIARVLSKSGESAWTPAADLASDDPFGPRNRLDEAAQWLTEAVGQKKRIDLVCLAVSDSMCRWLSAPSAEQTVITAAARGKGEEWGPGAALGTIEPLTSPHQKTKASAKAPTKRRTELHFPVLAVRDAPARVLLDNLDASGVRVGSVVTFWHALCRAWDDSLPTDRAREEIKRGSDNGNTELAAPSPITAIIASDSASSIAWAWSRGRQLITGGRAAVGEIEHADQDETMSPMRIAPDYDAAFGRLALDWLTWSAQLGQAPDRIIIVSPDAEAIARQCERLWPSAPTTLVPEIDPVASTLSKLIASDAIKPESDPRTCVASLTNRPSRAHRKLNQWVGVIMLAVAIAVIGLGWQFHSQAKAYDSKERQFQSEITTKLSDIDQRLARDPRPVRALENKINELSANSSGFEEPDAPLPILQELLRVAKAIEGADGVKIERIEITETRSTLRLEIPDTATGELVIEALRKSPGKIRWIEAAGPLTGRLNFNGAWTLEEPRL